MNNDTTVFILTAYWSINIIYRYFNRTQFVRNLSNMRRVFCWNRNNFSSERPVFKSVIVSAINTSYANRTIN
jgi:hypothetical protein